MRWNNLLLTESAPPDGMSAPLFEQGAVERTFDTPEFRGITFYEIRAKSIINRVPEASHVPFRWTINPYRGCSHACQYCLSGDTPILLADGRTKSLSDVVVGEKIYGTVWDGKYRRYVLTTVLAQWQTAKPAFRITLEDGTRLVASGDHRFLTDRGWKHVVGAMGGPHQRPYLTINNKLMGTGAFAVPPDHSADYQRGYLCGMIRGDGLLWPKPAIAGGSAGASARQFRLALIDIEGIRRTRQYLSELGVVLDEFVFQAAMGARQQLIGIGTGIRSLVSIVEASVCWPRERSDEWRKGFLAGIFDAEGGYTGGILRIGNTDPSIVAEITTCLMRLGFAIAYDKTGRPNGMMYVRITGGMREHLRFFHTVDPAITRKRSIEGRAIKNNAPLRVMSIEPLGVELPMYDITSGTGDFIANGVVSHNCFARNTHTYLDLDYGEDFNSKIVVKVNAAEKLRVELARPTWKGEHIAMGTNVDPYQRAEGRYKLMRGILEALRDFANPFSILTKGSLILRDIDLLQECADVAEVGTNVSVGFVDREMWRLLEPGTPSPQKRLEVCARLNAAGIPCGVLMAPIIPFLTDSAKDLEAAVRAIADSGATHISPIVLHLRPGAREWFMAWLTENHSELVPKYERLYARGSYAPKAYQQDVYAKVHEFAERFGVGKTSPTNTRRIRSSDEHIVEPEQLALI
jgi:DNA repair photolyase